MSERLPIEISGTIDLESADWTDVVLGVVYDGVVMRHWWTAPEVTDETLPPTLFDGVGAGETGGLDGMIDHLRARGGVYWCHGGGNFDFLAILERLRTRGIACQIDRSAQRCTRIVVGSLTLRDSWSLWPVPIDEISGALQRKVPHLPWPCTCGKKTCACGCGGCGGYCRIAERAREGDPDLLAYCEDDCKTLYDGLRTLRDFATKHRVCLRGTLAQTAWVNAQDELGLPESDISWHIWRQARRGNKGGRQCIVRPRAKGPGSHHDIVSAYPAQLARTELPVGACRELGGTSALRALERCRPGLYTLTVRVPDTLFLPPLPWQHAGTLYFPVGTVTGTWPLPELVAAFERGVTIAEVHTALIWESTAPIFAELVQRWYEIRRSAGKKTPLGQWTSRMAKAFTGKLAEKPERERVLMHPESIKVCLRTGPCRQRCSGRCGSYNPLDLYGKIWGAPYSRLGGSSYPQWSAYLRACTRVQWLEQAERYGEDLVMGNTDSLWTLGRAQPAPLGDGLGEWEYQDTWSDLDIRSVTMYSFRKLPDHQEFVPDYSHAVPRGEFVTTPGELIVRGIPWATEEDWKRGAGIIDRGVVTFGRAVKSPNGLWTKRTRKWTLPHRDRVLWGDRKLGEGGITYPMYAEEIREQVEIARQRRKRFKDRVLGKKKTMLRTMER